MSDDTSLATTRDEDLDETNAEDVILARPEWGSVAMLAAAASFGTAVPNAVAAANSQMFMSVERYGEFSISNGGGPLGQLTKEEIAAKKQEERDDGWTEWAQDMAEAHERQEREREQWAKTEHEFAGSKMTGDEWGELSQAIGKNGEMREWLIERLMKNGKSRKDAETKANEMSEMYRLMAKPESQRTPEEKAKIDQAKTDPDYLQNTAPLAKQRDDHYRRESRTEVEGVNADQPKSVSSRADALEQFPSAPDLKDHYSQAAAASEPLENKKTAPLQVAAVLPPAQAPGSGFDV